MITRIVTLTVTSILCF